MRPRPIVTSILATLICASAAFFIDAREGRKPWPKPTPPPPPSPIYTQSLEHVPGEAELEQLANEHNARLEREIEQAIVAGDSERREAAFTFLLPELVQLEPDRTVAILGRVQPGPARERFRTELTRQWIAKDPDAAVSWMKGLPESDRRASARSAMKSIIAYDPARAFALAREFDLKTVD